MVIVTGFPQDLRYAARSLLQRPLFAFVAVLSLGIGIGANTTIFSVANSLLLRPPPGVGGADRVVELGRTRNGDGFGVFSYPELQSIQAAGGPLRSVAGYQVTALSLSVGEDADRLLGFATSAEYFDALGTAPALGRFYAASEASVPGGEAVVVLSHAFWRDRFASDPAIVGRTITLNRHPFAVIGVSAEEFSGHITMLRPEVFIPLTMMTVAHPGFTSLTDERHNWLQLVARLSDGATLSSAKAALDALYARLALDNAERFEGRSVAVVPLTSAPAEGRGAIAGFLGVLMALVGLLLLVTCANVAGMLIARAAGREREIAIRLALGAGRGRLVRQLITESLVLFALGGAAGVLLATWGTRALGAINPPFPFPLHFDFAVDMRVLLFGIAAALLTGLIFGLAPALQATRPDLVPALRNESSRGSGGGGTLRRVFVAVQVGFTVMLLIAAGLFLRALHSASGTETGFSAVGVSVVSYDLSIDGYDEASGRLFQRQLAGRLAAAAGVTGVAFATDLPLDLSLRQTRVRPEGWSEDDAQRGLGSALAWTSSGFFRALGIELLRGRDFSAADTQDSEPVMIISRHFAERAWPGEDAIGKRVWLGSDQPEPVVVGVVGDVRQSTLMEELQPMMYLPLEQRYTPEVYAVVRHAGGAAAASALLRSTVRDIDPRLSTTPVMALADVNALGVLPQRVAAIATAAFGAVALLLSALGIYGVVAYMVTQRTREIGIRMAIGADRPSIMRLFVMHGLRTALPGAAFGALAGLSLAFVLRSLLLDITPYDPVALVGAPAVLLAAVLAACWVPAARASSVEPVVALRSD
jgi:putative ABC transport system permease protein